MLAPAIVAGMQVTTSLDANNPKELWQQFMPVRKSIPFAIEGFFYAIEIYNGIMDFASFNPQTTFQQWAAVEIEKVAHLPAGIETMALPGGLYATFIHRGRSETFFQTADYIYNNWLPGSGYLIDDRPHVQVMDENYNPAHEQAEEQILIPIAKK